jgi:hypothetical protein
VQVEPMRPMLKSPGSMLLKVRCGGPLSNFAFKINLRRYNEGVLEMLRAAGENVGPQAGAYTRPLFGLT